MCLLTTNVSFSGERLGIAPLLLPVDKSESLVILERWSGSCLLSHSLSYLSCNNRALLKKKYIRYFHFDESCVMTQNKRAFSPLLRNICCNMRSLLYCDVYRRVYFATNARSHQIQISWTVFFSCFLLDGGSDTHANESCTQENFDDHLFSLPFP